jgi:hypothetical protein
VPALTTRDVEETCTERQTEDLEDPRDLAAISFQPKEWLILLEVAGIEERRPPLSASGGTPGQKNTGSRYAPNTSSIAARISYSVQYARAQSRMNGMTFLAVAHASRSATRRPSQAA